jgi:hypothetical protein
MLLFWSVIVRFLPLQRSDLARRGKSDPSAKQDQSPLLHTYKYFHNHLVSSSTTPSLSSWRRQAAAAVIQLRNANCTGHWDASKDSLWVALQAAPKPAPDAPLNKTGDGGWLGQLRNSIASAKPPKSQTPDKPKEEKPKEKDEAVSSFFKSLLKNL